jgi:hypothetical protein
VFVYLITAVRDGEPAGPCKVGISGNPDKRLRSLNTASAVPLEIYEIWPFDSHPRLARVIEQFFHAAHAEFRLNGEWFDMEPEHARAMVELGITLKCVSPTLSVDRVVEKVPFGLRAREFFSDEENDDLASKIATAIRMPRLAA